eukprot:CAMPEP_0173292618 /NCGR_PEP_ID=MMETSP1143-20121109/12834_1 /TAXON_ID=483371 /ORGANISM="non described non described, Strain CCMP2298" /LENGTH=288 /DNA_ID=CAMNT_0014232037 /DNA_START=1 /DNA_END=867 /DNA_ORIENTATION=+
MLVLLFAIVSAAQGFKMQPSVRSGTALHGVGLKHMERLDNNLTPRVVLDTLPIVYVYDHCPFCVRVRLALGLKNIKHEVRYLANDDIATPTSLVGKKIAPIFAMAGSIDPMGESLDIIAKVDSNPTFGPVGFFKPASGRTDIKAWMKTVADANRVMQRPRYMLTMLPEFANFDGKNAFVKNHQLAPYEKADWKASLSDEQRWQLYDAAYESSLSLLDAATASLAELDALIYSADCCTEGGLSYDDIDLWSRLRSVTLVKGVQFTPKLQAYMDNLARLGDVPLYYSMAC